MNQNEFKKIVTMAIDNEIEARDFYKGVADRTRDPGLRQIFAELAEAEAGHKASLEKFLAGDIKQFEFQSVADYKVAESLEMPRLGLDMKPVEAVALAVKKEEEAMRMYQGLAAMAKDESQAALFGELAKMELGHKSRLEDLFTGMAYPEAW